MTVQDSDALPSEISLAMGVSSARVATALNSLEKKGFVTRKIDKDDRRKILVNITTEGRISSENHYQKMFKNTNKMLKLLGEHDSKELVRIIKILAEHVPTCKHD